MMMMTSGSFANFKGSHRLKGVKAFANPLSIKKKFSQLKKKKKKR
jgi:hypothetical protein